MKKNNKELTYTSKEVKLNKRNYIIIIIPIILVLTIIIAIAFYVFAYSNPSNKVKRYLDNIGYTCNKKTCVYEENNIINTYNYKNHTLLIETNEYRLTIGKQTPILEVKNNEQICSYIKTDYKLFTKVDTSFMYDRNCEKYLEEINNSIALYEKIITSSNVDVNKIEK